MTFYFFRNQLLIAGILIATLNTVVADSIPYCNNITLSADMLYLRACEKGLDRVVSLQTNFLQDSDGNILTSSKGRSSSPHYKWSPGFRLGAGYEIEDRNLKADLVWTHFNSKSNKNHSGNKIKWDLDFDTVDLILAYRFNWDYCIALRPFAGVRGANIDQDIHVDTFLVNTVHDKDKQHFSGIGPLVGLEIDWEMGCNFSFFTSASFSWLYGNQNVRRNDFTDYGDGSTLSKVKKHIHANQFVVDTALGIRWNTVVCNRDTYVQIGLENHQYFDYNYLTEGDLSLSGINISVGYKF